jgi:hypothetical protein
MAAGGWSNVRDALGDAGANQREDDAASRASTFSCVSHRPSVHSQQRGEEREISDDEIKQAKVCGRVSLAVRFDDDYGEQQARTKALEWGGQLMTALAGLQLSLGDGKAKGRPGDRRIEVELVRSERRARDMKRWLVNNGYFSYPNRVLYILQPSPRKEIVVVEGLLASGHIGVVTVFRRDDNGRELRSTTAAIILYCGVFSELLKANADGQALDTAFQGHVDQSSGTSLVGPGLPLSSWPPSKPFLHAAARMGCAAIVERLICHYGCDINARQEKDQGTALHLASYYGHGDVVELLLKHGADRTATNKYKGTALESAKSGQQDFERGKFEFPKVMSSGADDSALLKFHRQDSNKNSYLETFDFRTRDPNGWPSWDAVIRLLTNRVRQTSRMAETAAEPPPDAWDEADEESLVSRLRGTQLQEDPDKEVETRRRDAVLLRETDGGGFSSRGGRPRRRRPRPRRQFFSAAEAAAAAAEDALNKADGW